MKNKANIVGTTGPTNLSNHLFVRTIVATNVVVTVLPTDIAGTIVPSNIL